jgi:CRP-like cAMP-binding protein
MRGMDELTVWLEKHPVFTPLDEAGRTAFTAHATKRELRKGEALALQGDVWPYLFLVAEGEVDAVKMSSEGRNLLVTTFKTGELFWGVAFFQDEAPLVATLEAHSPSRIYLWPRQFAEPVFLANGRMGWELCRLMIQRMQRASAIVEELAFQPVAGRLARLLMDHFSSAREQSIERSLTLDEMAARVGTTQPIIATQCRRWTRTKIGSPWVIMRLVLETPFIQQKM